MQQDKLTQMLEIVDSVTRSSFANIELEGVKGVFLDLDNTLYDYEPCNKKGYEAVVNKAEELGIATRKELEQAWVESRGKVHDQLKNQAASHSRLLYLHGALELLSGRSQPALALHLEACFWNAYIESMQLGREAEAFLNRLKSRSLKTCIVTDLTSHIQFRKWEKLNLEKFVDFIVTSEEAGMEKPHAPIFLRALEKLNLQPAEVIMVGDNYEKDVLGGTGMGIRSYLI